ncbi:MAG: hypothetical protein R3E48_02030 [Burkholderiaceae bacterium]
MARPSARASDFHRGGTDGRDCPLGTRVVAGPADAGFARSGRGPSNLAVLGADTFLIGSSPMYFSTSVSDYSPAYDARATNQVYEIDAAVAARDRCIACAATR